MAGINNLLGAGAKADLQRRFENAALGYKVQVKDTDYAADTGIVTAEITFTDPKDKDADAGLCIFSVDVEKQILDIGTLHSPASKTGLYPATRAHLVDWAFEHGVSCVRAMVTNDWLRDQMVQSGFEADGRLLTLRCPD